MPNMTLTLVAVLAIGAALFSFLRPKTAFLLVVFSTPFMLGVKGNPLLMRLGVAELVFTLFLTAWLARLVMIRGKSRNLNTVHFLCILFMGVVLLSLVGIQEAFKSALIETVVLGYLVFFCIMADQVIDNDDDLRRVLDAWMLGAAVIAIIGMIDVAGVLTRGAPILFPSKDPHRVMATFRRPPQLAVYALATFFMAIAYSTMGGMTARKRWLLRLLAMVMVILIIFTSRRSVLVALVVGMGLVIIMRTPRFSRALVFALLFMAALSAAHEMVKTSPALTDFFGHRLRILVSGDALDHPFLRANVEDAMNAFSEHPLLGIGYGTFSESEYASTGNEVHSTVLRVLGECGLAGFIVYLVLTVCIFVLAYRNIRLADQSPWQDFARMVLPALFALHVSYLYNRCFRDRTYWLIIALVIALHRLLVVHAKRRAAAAQAGRSQPPPAFTGRATMTGLLGNAPPSTRT
ncbi:MAG TPA: hypothetical protein PK280_06930 [Planctomycetota bacterium]|nr:hypothetical protein [Planctomycetota bacterium]